MEWSIDEMILSNILKSSISNICSNIFANNSTFSIIGGISLKIDNGFYEIVINFNDVYKIPKSNISVVYNNDQRDHLTNIHSSMQIMNPRVGNAVGRIATGFDNAKLSNSKINSFQVNSFTKQNGHRISPIIMPRSQDVILKNSNLYPTISVTNTDINFDVNEIDVTLASSVLRTNSVGNNVNNLIGNHHILTNSHFLHDTYIRLEDELKSMSEIKKNINSSNSNKMSKKLSNSNHPHSIHNLSTQSKCVTFNTYNTTTYSQISKLNETSYTENKDKLVNTNAAKLTKSLFKTVTSDDTRLVPCFLIKTNTRLNNDENKCLNNYHLNQAIVSKANLSNANYLFKINYQENIIIPPQLVSPKLNTNVSNQNINKTSATLNNNLNIITPFKILKIPLPLTEQEFLLSSNGISDHGYSKVDTLDSLYNYSPCLQNFNPSLLEGTTINQSSKCVKYTDENINIKKIDFNSSENDPLIELQKQQVLLAKQVLDNELLRQKLESENLQDSLEKCIDNLVHNSYDIDIPKPVSNDINLATSCNQHLNIVRAENEGKIAQNLVTPILYCHDNNKSDRDVSSSTLENNCSPFEQTILKDVYFNETVSVDNNLESQISNNIKLCSSNMNLCTMNVNKCIDDECLPLLEKMKDNGDEKYICENRLREQIFKFSESLYTLKKKVLLACEAIWEDNLMNQNLLDETEELLKCLDNNNSIFIKSFKVLPFNSIFFSSRY